jgi:predicted S18 family serine protease
MYVYGREELPLRIVANDLVVDWARLSSILSLNLSGIATSMTSTTSIGDSTIHITETTATTTSTVFQTVETNWLQANWQYDAAIVVAAIFVISGILLAYRRQRIASKPKK